MAELSDLEKGDRFNLGLLLAAAYFQVDSLDKATEKIDMAIALEPDSVQKCKIGDLLQRLAWDLVKRNENLGRALEFCDKALLLDPSNPAIIYDTQGWVYFRKGEYAKAQACMKEAAKRNPENEKFQKDLEIVSNALKGIKQEIEIK